MTRDQTDRMSLTRRRFLSAVGWLGGADAAAAALRALGLAAPVAPYGGPPQLVPGSGAQAHVLVLGAGLAGLVAAYELTRAGYRCTVLEATARPGGRTRSLRRGDVVESLDGTSQACAFDEGLHFNAGASRIPSGHAGVLDYCRRLAVPLEVAVARNDRALICNARAWPGRARQIGEVIAETQQRVAELLAKSLSRGALDRELGPEERERALEFLRIYGGVRPPARGVRSAAPDAPAAALDAAVWRWIELRDGFLGNSTTFQPVGGMDRLSTALAAALPEPVRYRHEVRELHKLPAGVRIVARDHAAAREVALEADHCVCTLPFPVLRALPGDWSAAHRRAMEQVRFEDATRIAWQSRRFWEQAGIYGGVSFPGDRLATVWYPSETPHAPQGILIGGYTTGFMSRTIAARPLPEQLEASRRAVERLHPGCSGELRRPLAVSWQQLPYSLGAWARPPSPDDGSSWLEVLREPDGRIHFAGDQLSDYSGWQEGAVRSAHRAVQAIARCRGGDGIRSETEK